MRKIRNKMVYLKWFANNVLHYLTQIAAGISIESKSEGFIIDCDCLKADNFFVQKIKKDNFISIVIGNH